MIRGRWVWDRTRCELVPADEFYARKYADVTVSKLSAPMVLSDVEPYRSVVDGSVIGGRRQHRDHLRAHGCVEMGNETLKPRPRLRSPKAEVVADIKRSMEDGNLRAEALAASRRAERALQN